MTDITPAGGASTHDVPASDAADNGKKRAHETAGASASDAPGDSGLRSSKPVKVSTPVARGGDGATMTDAAQSNTVASFHALPEEVLGNYFCKSDGVISFLNMGEFRNLCATNTHFHGRSDNQLVQQARKLVLSLKKQVDSFPPTYEKFSSRSKHNALLCLATLSAQLGDIVTTKAILQQATHLSDGLPNAITHYSASSSDRSEYLERIAQIYVSIGDAQGLSHVLGKAATAVEAFRPDKKAASLLTIAEIQFKGGDTEGMQRTIDDVRAMTPSLYQNERERLLITIAGLETSSDNIEGATQTIRSLSGSERKIHAFLSVVDAQHKNGDLDGAKVTLAEAKRVMDDLVRGGRHDWGDGAPFSSAPVCVARIEAQLGEFETARQTVLLLSVPGPSVPGRVVTGSERAKGFLAIARVHAQNGDALLAKERIADAEAVVRRINYFPCKHSLMTPIAILKADIGDMKGSMDVFESMNKQSSVDNADAFDPFGSASDFRGNRLLQAAMFDFKQRLAINLHRSTHSGVAYEGSGRLVNTNQNAFDWACVLAQSGHSTDAKAVANRIPDAYFKAFSLAHIAKAQWANGDPDEARQTIKEAKCVASGAADTLDGVLALESIGLVQAEMNDIASANQSLNEAKSLVPRMTNDCVKAVELMRINELRLNVAAMGAERSAGNFDPTNAVQIKSEVSRLADRGDAEAALNLAGTFTNIHFKHDAIFEVIKILAVKGDVVRAKSTLQGLTTIDARQRDTMLQTIAEIQAINGDDVGALETTVTIHEGWNKDCTLNKLVSIRAGLGDFEGAARIAHQIQTHLQRPDLDQPMTSILNACIRQGDVPGAAHMANTLYSDDAIGKTVLLMKFSEYLVKLVHHRDPNLVTGANASAVSLHELLAAG